MSLRLPFLLLIKVSLSLLTQCSSTSCYFITEYQNANHRLFPRWRDIIVISTQTSFLSPCLPTSCTLPTNFSWPISHSINANKAFPFFSSSQGPPDSPLGTTPCALVLHIQPCCTHASLFTRYNLEGQPLFPILSYIPTVI